MLFVTMFVLSAVLLVYLSNKHQRMLNQPFPRKCRFAALALLIGSGYYLLQHFSLAASIALLVLLLMLLATLVPLLGLVQRGKA